MIDCHHNMPPGACACDIPGPDFYDSDAQQLAAETAYELFEFSLLRPRREAQADRLWENEEGWVSTIWLAANWKTDSRVNYRRRLERMQRQAGLRFHTR